MNELLLKLANRLEQQDLLLVQMQARLDALESSYDLCIPGAAQDRLDRVRAAVSNSDGYRQALETQHQDLRKLISKLPD